MTHKSTLIVCLFAAIGSCSCDAYADEQCSSVSDCAQKAMEAAYQAKLALQVAVPKGAVMAFNLKECPPGWMPFPEASGRVVVGAGKDSEGTLTERKLQDKGGEEKHKLTIEEMPPHKFGTNGMAAVPHGTDAYNAGGHNYQATTASPNNIETETLGKGHPIPIMPPFYALLYCTRQ